MTSNDEHFENENIKELSVFDLFKNLFVKIKNALPPNVLKSLKKISETFQEVAGSLNYNNSLTTIEYPLFLYNDSNFFREFILAENKETFIQSYFDKNRINKILYEWTLDKHIKQDRLEPLKEAINCHNHGDYFACVTILMCQVSGIIHDNKKAFVKLGAVFDEKYKDKLKQRYNIIKESDKLDACELCDYINYGGYSLHCFLEYILKYVYGNVENKKILAKNPNRNKICHGEFCDFGNKSMSLKSIFIIDGLINLPNCFEKDQTGLKKLQAK